tara:strand:+ start:95 stop:499 length:405 start_codon:yes stop_codon:yes gene_type:complete
MFFLKGCPKCHGDMRFNIGDWPENHHCLNCGKRVYRNTMPMMQAMAETQGLGNPLGYPDGATLRTLELLKQRQKASELVQIKQEGQALTITVDLTKTEEAPVSQSGKSKVLFSTHGNVQTDKGYMIGLNVYTRV